MDGLLVYLEGAKPTKLLKGTRAFLSDQMEVHIPNVYFAMTGSSEQELVDRIDCNRVDVFDVLCSNPKVRRSQSDE